MLQTDASMVCLSAEKICNRIGVPSRPSTIKLFKIFLLETYFTVGMDTLHDSATFAVFQLSECTTKEMGPISPDKHSPGYVRVTLDGS